MKDLQINIPCSVSRELVIEVANMHPEIFRDKEGNLILEAVLFALGFKINHNAYNQGVYTIGVSKEGVESDGVWIRNKNYPSEVYRTVVYNGSLRNKIDYVKNGRIYYTKDWHQLAFAYINQEILQPDNLEDYFQPEEFCNILEVGELKAYCEGMNKLDKPDDGSTKNVVRS